MKEIFVLPSRLFSMVNPLLFGINYDNGIEGPVFVIGNKYFLQAPFPGMGRSQEKVYELVGIIRNFNGVDVDSLIMRQVSGELGTIFSLSKRDCSAIGIPYEDRLQLFPMDMNWKPFHGVEVEFKDNDLSTAPKSKIDGTIRDVLLKINGFSDYINGYIKTPSGKLVREHEIYKRISIRSNLQLLYGIDNLTIEVNQKLPIRLEHPNKMGIFFPYGNCISSDGSIYVSVSLAKNTFGFSSDGKLGIDSRFLVGIDPNELFTISVDETGLLRADEYAAKALSKRMEMSAVTWQNEIEAKVWNELSNHIKIIC